MKSSLLDSQELEPLRAERKRLQDDLQEERRFLDALRKERADLEGEVRRLRLAREQCERKLGYV